MPSTLQSIGQNNPLQLQQPGVPQVSIPGLPDLSSVPYGTPQGGFPLPIAASSQALSAPGARGPSPARPSPQGLPAGIGIARAVDIAQRDVAQATGQEYQPLSFGDRLAIQLNPQLGQFLLQRTERARKQAAASQIQNTFISVDKRIRDGEFDEAQAEVSRGLREAIYAPEYLPQLDNLNKRIVDTRIARGIREGYTKSLKKAIDNSPNPSADLKLTYDFLTNPDTPQEALDKHFEHISPQIAQSISRREFRAFPELRKGLIYEGGTGGQSEVPFTTGFSTGQLSAEQREAISLKFGLSFDQVERLVAAGLINPGELVQQATGAAMNIEQQREAVKAAPLAAPQGALSGSLQGQGSPQGQGQQRGTIESPFLIPPAYSAVIEKYGPQLDKVAKQYGLSGKDLMAKTFGAESAFNAQAVSRAGARGAAQFMPATRQKVLQVTKGRVDPWSGDPAQEAEAMVLHMTGQLGHAQGLEGYNPQGGKAYVDTVLNSHVVPASQAQGTTQRGAIQGQQEQVTPQDIGKAEEERRSSLAAATAKKEEIAKIEAQYGTRTAQDVVPGKRWYDSKTLQRVPKAEQQPYAQVLNKGLVGFDETASRQIDALNAASKVLALLEDLYSKHDVKKSIVKESSDRLLTWGAEYFPAPIAGKQLSLEQTAKAMAKSMLENEYFKGNSTVYRTVNNLLDRNKLSNTETALAALSQARMTMFTQTQSLFGLAERPELPASEGEQELPSTLPGPSQEGIIQQGQQKKPRIYYKEAQ